METSPSYINSYSAYLRRIFRICFNRSGKFCNNTKLRQMTVSFIKFFPV
jgi:hypothetical protein